MSNVGGALQITNICSTQYDRFFTTEIGRTYEFQADFDVSLAENLFISFHVHPTDCSTNLSSQTLPVSTGHFSYTFTAISTCSRITIRNLGNSNNGGTFKIDNISFLRKIVNHREVSNQVGDKQYELANHLGNVLNVVTDRKLPFVYDSNTSGLVDYVTADVKSFSDYYPFGMQLPKRHGREGIEDYRYAFNGMEKDNELKHGDGNSYTTEFRQYDPRIGKWFTLDPKDGHPNLIGRSPYHFAYNNPIMYTDEQGDIPWPQLVAKYTSIGGLALARTIKQLDNKPKPHHGLDMTAPMGTSIYAAAKGKVIHAGPCSGYGNAIIIDHGNGFVTLYGHMKARDIHVKVGDKVENGQEISKVGNEGGSTGSHLHVEYIYNSDGSNKAFWSKKGEKNKHVYDPRSINDLQDVITGKEEFTGKFLEEKMYQNPESDIDVTVTAIRQMPKLEPKPADFGLKDLPPPTLPSITPAVKQK